MYVDNKLEEEDMITVSPEVRQFLTTCCYLLDENLYSEFYEACYPENRQEVTDFLLSIDIDPTYHLSAIPEKYLWRTRNTTDYTVSEGVKCIERQAFGSDQIKNVDLPASVEKIEKQAFQFCGITSMVLPDRLKVISKMSFYWCESLTHIVIGKNITCIQQEAFSMCSQLTTIEYKGTKEQWKAIQTEKCAFYNVPCKSVRCSDGFVRLRHN